MRANNEKSEGLREGGITGPQAISAGWLVVAAVSAAFVVSAHASLRASSLLAPHLLYDAGHFLALALATGGPAAAWRRWGGDRLRRPLLADAGLLLIGSAAVAVLVAPADLSGFSMRMGALAPPKLVLWTCVGVVALSVPILRVLAALLCRRGIGRACAGAAGLSIAIANGVWLQRDYPGGHLFAALSSVTLLASAFAGLRLPRPLARPLPAILSVTPARSVALAIASAAAAASLAVPPGPAVASVLLRSSASVLPPYLSRFQRRERRLSKAEIRRETREWFEPRDGRPPIAATRPALLPPNGVVLLFVVDAMRADILEDEGIMRQLPTMESLSRHSVAFTTARSPGTQTVYAISAIFSGKYFSQMYWTRASFDEGNGIYPHEDLSVRFPEILAKAGIPTATFSATHWLLNRWGCARGFTEETAVPPRDEHWAEAPDLADAVLARLKRQGDGPLFLYAQFLDPHSPYDSSPVKGTEWERWIGELAVVDAQLGRLLSWLDASPLAERAVVIVASDHGEAFGDHGTSTHGKTLYEELVRVPLWIRLPYLETRRVNNPVSLVDLGPTILDLMGQPTPGHYMGQSLVPFLQGGSPRLTRPIVAEGRMKKMMVLPDGMKIIVDDHGNTEELYDLRKDPLEMDNLVGDAERLERPLSLLRRFFRAHTIRREGYRLPYRP